MLRHEPKAVKSRPERLGNSASFITTYCLLIAWLIHCGCNALAALTGDRDFRLGHKRLGMMQAHPWASNGLGIKALKITSLSHLTLTHFGFILGLYSMAQSLNG